MASPGYIAPPVPGQPVPKEYVRQQLVRLGIRNVTEEELEFYAADLTKLIRSNLVGGPQTTAAFHLGREREKSGAVFKMFPDDKENGVRYLTPSPTPSPAPNSSPRSLPTSFRRVAKHPAREVMSPLTPSPENTPAPVARKLMMKRKVMRQGAGSSRLVEESESELESDTSKLMEGLASLSLTPLSSSAGPSELEVTLVPESTTDSTSSFRPPSGLKSFIRPSIVHPHNREVRKCDPVARYHEYRQLWQQLQPPGERPRNVLRWHIRMTMTLRTAVLSFLWGTREQMMQQDVPYFKPRRRVLSANNYVVPTAKKRQALRWQVRHDLAL